MSGSTAVFKTQCPTPEEMETCQKVFMSDPEYWDPINVEFNVSSVYENTRTTYNTCDYDTAMSQISDGYHQPTLYKKFINSVTIKFPITITAVKKLTPMEKPKINEYGTSLFTSNRHHTISAEFLAKKWGCGLNTARNTLAGTTKLGVRSAIGPLTRRYRTDILQMHYRRLNTCFYTDTLFMKAKSLKGKTCAQIYTDGKGYIRTDPIESKS